MRKLINNLLVAVLIFGLFGCGGQTDIKGIKPSAESDFPKDSKSHEVSKPFIEKENLNNNDSYYVELSKCLYIVGFKKDGDMTEREKGAFFKWIISTKDYTEQCKSWWNQDKQTYEIPLSDIEHIIFAHLDVSSFNPEKAFNEISVKEYDSEKQVLKVKTIGGYGGAAALEALNIMRGNGTVTIELGVFDMEKFYAEPPEYILIGKYTVEYLVLEDDGNTKDFKIVNARVE